MKYVSIDIETAGLGKDCSILEFAAVLDDLANPQPIDELATFHTYFLNDRIIGEPYALAMHKTIFERIAKLEDGWRYIPPQDLMKLFFNFLKDHDYEITKRSPTWYIEINVAGKNFAMFDKNWVEPLFGNSIKISHRVIDPAMLYLNPTVDKGLPSSKECLKRAKLDGEVAHNALDDAIMVCRLLRRHYYH